jgi:hypothetical protein
MISSLRPLRNRIGILVILGSVSSVGQIWWQSGVKNRAGGKALLQVNDALQIRRDYPRWYEFLDRGKRILQDDAGNVALPLIASSQSNGNCTTDTLTVYYNLRISKFVPLADVIQPSLRIDHEPLFVRIARR